jgi:hypothetical protein
LLQFANTTPRRFVYSGIIVEAMRQTWTDDRMDDLVRRVDTGFAQVDTRFAQESRVIARELREEISGLRAEMMQRFDDHDRRHSDALQQTLIWVSSAGIISLLVAHFA